jgi:hypothetical protein
MDAVHPHGGLGAAGDRRRAAASRGGGRQLAHPGPPWASVGREWALLTQCLGASWPSLAMSCSGLVELPELVAWAPPPRGGGRQLAHPGPPRGGGRQLAHPGPPWASVGSEWALLTQCLGASWPSLAMSCSGLVELPELVAWAPPPRGGGRQLAHPRPPWAGVGREWALLTQRLGASWPSLAMSCSGLVELPELVGMVVMVLAVTGGLLTRGLGAGWPSRAMSPNGLESYSRRFCWAFR